MVNFPRRVVYGCTSIIYVLVPPTYLLALHPPPSGVNTIHWSPGDSDDRLLPDLSSLCALRVPLSGSFSLQPSAIVTWQWHKAVPPDHGSPSSRRGEYLEPGPQEPQRKIGSSLCHQYCPFGVERDSLAKTDPNSGDPSERKRPKGAHISELRFFLLIRKIPLLFLKCSNIQCKNLKQDFDSFFFFWLKLANG